MNPLRVLFICIHNGARSQMAETYLNDFGKGQFIAESAGIEPGTLNPLVVQVLAEEGYDLAGKQTHSVFDYSDDGRKYDIVVKVCDQSSGQRCPIFPSTQLNLIWSFPDPSGFQGTEAEKLAQTRAVRDAIRQRIQEFVNVIRVA